MMPGDHNIGGGARPGPSLAHWVLGAIGLLAAGWILISRDRLNQSLSRTLRPLAAEAGPSCTGSAAGEPLSAIVSSPWDVAVADIDADGNMDLVVSQDGGSMSIRLLMNMGDSMNTGLWRCVNIPSTATQRLAIGDIDGDGTLDVIAGQLDRSVAWWLLGPGQTVRTSGTLAVSLAQATSPSGAASCKSMADADVQLSSMDLGDVHSTGRPTVTMTFWDGALQKGEPCLNRLDFHYDGTSARLVQDAATPGPGMMRGRFADVDGDDRLDFVGSAYATVCPGGASSCSTGIWGSVSSGSTAPAAPLTQTFANDGGALPPMTAVDFDVFPGGLASRNNDMFGGTVFGVALTAFDSCKAESCWVPPFGGGYSYIASMDGGTVWSSAGSERGQEDAGAGMYLSPESLTFVDRPGGGLGAAYRWANYCKDCGDATRRDAIPLRVSLLQGSIMTVDGIGINQPTFTTYPPASSMLRVAVAPGGANPGVASRQVEQQPVVGSNHIYYVGNRNVVAVDRVSVVSTAGTNDVAFSWYPGDAWISLRNPAQPGTLRISYRAAMSPILIVADHTAGLIFQQFN